MTYKLKALMDSAVKWTGCDSANAAGTMRQSEKEGSEVRTVEGKVVPLSLQS